MLHISNRAWRALQRRLYVKDMAEKAPAIDGRDKLSNAEGEALSAPHSLVGPNASLSLCQRPRTCPSAPKICLSKPMLQEPQAGYSTTDSRRAPMPLYWLCYRHNNQISVVIEPPKGGKKDDFLIDRSARKGRRKRRSKR